MDRHVQASMWQNVTLRRILYHYVHFHDCFQCEPGLTGSLLVFFLHLELVSRRKPLVLSGTGCLQCQSTEVNSKQWPGKSCTGLILSSFTTGLLREGALLPHQFPWEHQQYRKVYLSSYNGSQDSTDVYFCTYQSDCSQSYSTMVDWLSTV